MLTETVALLAAQDKGIVVWAAMYIGSPEGPERTYFCYNFDYNMGNCNAVGKSIKMLPLFLFFLIFNCNN